MTIYKENSFAERRQKADEAKKALLEKFKAKPGADDPAVAARQAERKAIAEARAQREAERLLAKKEKAEREARERAEREAAAAEAARAEAEANAKSEYDLISQLAEAEADRKAKRDARYAARKARQR